MKKPLGELYKGQKGRIDSFNDKALSLKLMEMGFLPGEVIQLSHIAPMGDPIAVSVSGYILSLRLEEANTIIVEC
jgi:ferrous iron transport protein A